MHCSPSKPIAVQQHKIGKSRPHTAARVSGGYPVSCARSRSAIVRGDRRGMRPNAWCFFCPLRFPTTSTRRHLEKSRREKSCAHVRGFADFYQRFFFGETLKFDAPMTATKICAERTSPVRRSLRRSLLRDRARVVLIWKMRGVFFAPSDFPPRPRAGIWKNRVAKNRVLMVRGFADFYQRFFFGETPSQKNPDVHRRLTASSYLWAIRLGSRLTDNRQRDVSPANHRPDEAQ